jgi:C4-type Zn-finger protein
MMNAEIQLICRDCGLELREHNRTTDPLTGKVTIRVHPCQACMDGEWDDGYDAARNDLEDC